MLNLRKLLIGVLLASLVTFALADGGGQGSGLHTLPLPMPSDSLPN